MKSSVTNTLKGQVDETTSLKTGVITVTVHAKYPELAVQIAQGLLDQVNAFNLSRRQESASAEREFIERRLAEAQGSCPRLKTICRASSPRTAISAVAQVCSWNSTV